MSTKSSTSSNKKKRDYDGRVFIFTARKHYKDQCQLAKTIISDMDMDPSEIKIDDKPYLYEIMTKLSNGRSELPQIFFNDTYIGSLGELLKLKERGVLRQMIEEAKNASDPGPLYKVYRTQNELFLISLPDLYFPPPLNRQITCVVRLINRTNKYTVYKLKTTNPKKFNVSPKQGFLPPGQSERLEVSMNDADVPTKQDKFRVEGILLSYGSDDMKNMVEDVFKQADAKSIIKQTINCKFEAPPENMKITQYNDGTIMVEELNATTSLADEIIPQMNKSSHEAFKEDDLSPKWIETGSQLDRIPESMTQSFMQDDVSSPMFQSMNEYHIPSSPRQQEQEAVTAMTTQESVPYIDTSAGYINVPTTVEQVQEPHQTDSELLATVTDQHDKEQEDSERIAREREEAERREHEESLLRDQQKKEQEQREQERREQERREQERREQERKEQERKEQERREEEQRKEQARREQEQREQEEALQNAKLMQENERREREKREEDEKLKRIEEEEELRKLESLAKETKETIDKRVSKKETQQLLQQIDSVEYEKLKEEYKRLVDQLKSVVEQNKALEENYRSEIQKQKDKVKEVEDLLASERSLRKRNIADKSSVVAATKNSTTTEISQNLPTEQQYDFVFVIIAALVAFIFGWLM